MEPASLDISIPQIPPLTNKSIVTIHAFVSLKHIYVSVPINKPEVDKFIKDLNIFCITCTYFFVIIFLEIGYILNLSIFSTTYY